MHAKFANSVEIFYNISIFKTNIRHGAQLIYFKGDMVLLTFRGFFFVMFSL